MLTIVHLSPHPDDEIIGAGGTLLELRSRGHRIINLALTLGTEPKIRGPEAIEANKRAGFELIFSEAEYRGHEGQDFLSLEQQWAAEVSGVLVDRDADLLVAPQPSDAHPTHQVVGRLACRLAQQHSVPLWLWGIWSDLSAANLLAPLPGARLGEQLAVLGAYQSQLKVRDYRRLVEGRALVEAVRGPERIFGPQATEPSPHWAELLLALRPDLTAAPPRVIDWERPISEISPVVSSGD